MIAVPPDLQPPRAASCNFSTGSGSSALGYWPYAHASNISVSNTVFRGNSASKDLVASGGALCLGSGGNLVVGSCTVEDNSASLFGGGIALGRGGPSDTCGVSVVGGTMSGNTASHGGSQLYMGCQADMVMNGTSIVLNTYGSQVEDRVLVPMCLCVHVSMWAARVSVYLSVFVSLRLFGATCVWGCGRVSVYGRVGLPPSTSRCLHCGLAK
jgi:hypothetical protein